MHGRTTAQVQTKRSLKRWLSEPLAWIVLATACLLFFILWFLLTLGPIIRVEASYQIKKIAQVFLPAQDWRDLFMPSMSLDLRSFQAANAYDGIVIPKVFVDAPVVYNVDPNDVDQYTKALKVGIAHASSTAFPDNGQLGYYFAHSSSPELRSQYNAVFYLLGKLETGDEIFLWHQGERYEYRVTDSLIVDPNDVAFLNDDYPNETIVLQTCWPPGTTQKRLLVFAERVTQ